MPSPVTPTYNHIVQCLLCANNPKMIMDEEWYYVAIFYGEGISFKIMDG